MDFHDLVAAWRRDCAQVSDLHERVAHPAYQAIIALGAPVIPLLLRELATRPDTWEPALEALTGEAFDTRSAWLAWGRAHGYLEGD